MSGGNELASVLADFRGHVLGQLLDDAVERVVHASLGRGADEAARLGANELGHHIGLVGNLKDRPSDEDLGPGQLADLSRLFWIGQSGRADFHFLQQLFQVLAFDEIDFGIGNQLGEEDVGHLGPHVDAFLAPLLER